MGETDGGLPKVQSISESACNLQNSRNCSLILSFSSHFITLLIIFLHTSKIVIKIKYSKQKTYKNKNQ